MPMRTRPHGFTLVELLVAMAIFAILVLLALPSFTQFLANTQVRNAAESLLMGARLAQQEAVKHNAVVSFNVDPAAGWSVTYDDPESGKTTTVQSWNLVQGAPKASLTVTPGGATRVAFNGLGRAPTEGNPRNPDDDSDAIQKIDVTTSATASPHDLRVVIIAISSDANKHGLRMCDPASTFDATDHPEGC